MMFDNIIDIILYKYNHGYSLKKLYYEIIDAYGLYKGPIIFNTFLKKNIKNKKIINEFNKTSFI